MFYYVSRIVFFSFLFCNFNTFSGQFYYGKYAEQHVIELLERYIEQYKKDELKNFLGDGNLILNENSSFYLKEKSKKVFENIWDKQATAYFATKTIAGTLALLFFMSLLSDDAEETIAARLFSFIGLSVVCAWPWKNEQAFNIMNLIHERINKPYN